MDGAALHEEDIYAWSQHQAAVLRRMAALDPAALPNDLDLQHVAEEIEDVGNEQRYAVESSLVQLFAHLLRTALGTPGASVLLVLLVLQLSAAGGTYPPSLLPGFFAALHPFLPMTYLIDAFRVTISGGQLPHLARDVVVLLVVAVAALGLVVATVRRRQQFRMADLHPPLVAP